MFLLHTVYKIGPSGSFWTKIKIAFSYKTFLIYSTALIMDSIGNSLDIFKSNFRIFRPSAVLYMNSKWKRL